MTYHQLPPCPLRKKCGGCQVQNMTYERQLAFKEANEIKLLSQFCRVEPIIGMDNPYHYRNKVQAAFGLDAHRRIISGVYQSSSHKIVPVDSCQLEDELADEIIVFIRKNLRAFHISVYDEHTGKGCLRHVLVKRGFGTGEVMVVLVTGTPVLPSKNEFVRQLLSAFPDIRTVIQNINPGRTNLVLGKTEKVLYGSGTITDRLCGLNFRISASAFYQINPVQTEVLYRTAIEYAGLSGNETVLDTYCGVGTIGLCASSGAKNVIGVELNPSSVRDAIGNAKRNGIKNARFICADAGDFMRECSENGERPDVVFMDPPRAGSTRVFVDALVNMAPPTVVYISCNPETLARDLHWITDGGYTVKKIQPVDMFPHTSHVETVVLLTKVQ